MARSSSIGLDIGTSAVRAAEVAFTRTGAVLERFAAVPLPDGAVRDGEVADVASVTAALKELWGAGRFRSRKVVLGVASQRVVVRTVDLPKMPAADLRKALPFQVQDVLPMPVEQATLDFHPVEERTSGGQTLVRGLLVAAATETVMTRIEAVRGAGLRPVGVDLVPFALLRSIGLAEGTGTGAEAVVDIGARVTNVTVHDGGSPRFVRVLLGGGDRLVDELVGQTSLDSYDALQVVHRDGLRGNGDPRVTDVLLRAAERVVDGVRGSLDYYTGTGQGGPLEGVVLSGGTSLVPGFDTLLSEAVSLPVRRGDALGRLVPGRAGAQHDPRLTALGGVPIGLALAGAA